MKPELPRMDDHPEKKHDTILKIYKVLRGNVSFGDGTNNDNVDCQWVKGTTPGAANTEFNLTHKLGRIPVGFHITTKNGACDVYQSTTAWTNTKIYLKANGTTINITLLVY